MRNKFLKDGLILLNKNKDVSSSKAINRLKWLINANKIGHAGTLDPMAQGLLIVMVNGATKFSDDLMKKDKEYYVEMELGYETDTYDLEGKVTKKYNEKIEFSNEKIVEVVNSFLGESEQIPPMYSAIKIEGKKLYDLARKGIEIERKARKIKINSIYKIEYDKNKKVVSFFTNVSSGTYIRSLVRDIGEKLGVYATMTKLIRTKIDKFDLKNAINIEDIEKIFSNEKIIEENEVIENLKLCKIENIFNYEKININEEEYKKIKNGMTVLFEFSKFKEIELNKKLKIYLDKEFKGIVEIIQIGENKVYIKRGKYIL